MSRLLFTLFLLQFSYSQAQNPWLYENSFEHGFQILESYDGGTLILATENGQSDTGKVIKLNKLGGILWEHTIEDSDSYFMPVAADEDSFGNLIIGGVTNRYSNGDYVGAYLLKLNPCGELLWLKNMGIENAYDYISYLQVDNNNQIILVHYIPFNDNHFTLEKVNQSGEVLWSRALLEGGGGSPDGFSTTKDGGFLVHGTYYAPPYYDQESSTVYLRNAIVKTDSLGNEEWRNIYRWEEDTQDTIYLSIDGEVVELDNKQYCAITLDKNHPLQKPVMYKLNENGETIWHKHIGKADTLYGNTKVKLFNDSTIVSTIVTVCLQRIWTNCTQI